MKVLIVDDEPLARSALLRLCESDEEIEVIGQAESGQAAIRASELDRPDVVLLDVGLPDMSGFDVLHALHDAGGPLAILVTGHTEHAVAAFEAGAIDYLVKPVTAGRFARSIARARVRLDGCPAASAPGLNSLRPTLLVGEKDRKFYPLTPDRIDYIESDGNYVTFRTGDADYISRDSIKRLALLLSSAGFLRIERSLLVNTHVIRFIEPKGHGAFAFTLASGSVLQSSATYRQEILRTVPLVRTVKSVLHAPQQRSA